MRDRKARVGRLENGDGKRRQGTGDRRRKMGDVNTYYRCHFI